MMTNKKNKKSNRKTLSLTVETIGQLDKLRAVRGGLYRGCDPCGTNPTICE